MHEQEGAGAVRLLPFPFVEASLAEKCGLLVASNSAYRNLAPEKFGRRNPEAARRGTHLGEDAHGNPEQVAQLLAPLTALEVVQHRARSVGGIGGVHRATRQAPHEPAVNRSREQLAAPRAIEVVPLCQQPL